jgi:SNF2 family DNA or RNA helicase
MAQNELISAYQNLDPLRKRILQVVALAYRVPTERYYYGFDIVNSHGLFLKSLLTQLSVDNKGKVVTEKEYKLLINSLIKEKFLLNRHGDCEINFVFYLCKEALSPENIKQSLPLISENMSFNSKVKFNSWHKFNLYDETTVSHDDMRLLNIAIHTNDVKIFEATWNEMQQLQVLTMFRHLFYRVTLDDEWVKSRLAIYQQILCVVKLTSDVGYAADQVKDYDCWVKLFLTLPQPKERKNFPLLSAQLNQLNIHYANYSIIVGQETSNQWAKNFSAARESLILGEAIDAVKKFELSIREFSTFAPRDHWFWLSDASILYMIGLIRSGKVSKIASTIVNRLDKQPHLQVLTIIFAGINSLVNNDLEAAKHYIAIARPFFLNLASTNLRNITEYALYSWLCLLVTPAELKWDTVKHYFKICQEQNSPLAKTIYSELILNHEPDNTAAQEALKHSPYNGLNLLELVSIKKEWEYTVDKLAALLATNDDAKAKKIAGADKRLIWLLDPLKSEVVVLEQQAKKNGGWTGGKNVTTTRLAKRTDLEYITPQDNAGIFALEPDPYRKNSYIWNYSRLLLNLVGHPNLFDYNNHELQLELIKDNPELIVKSTKDGFKLQLSHIAKQSGIGIEKISASKYKLIEFDEQMVNLGQLINKGVTLPAVAKDRLLDIVCKTNPNLKINADIVDENLPTADANSTLHVQLTPSGEGLLLNVFMRPFGTKGGYYLPAQGLSAQVTQDNNGKPVKLVRKFKLETSQYNELVDGCPILNLAQLSNYEWGFDDLEQALQLLSELHTYKQQGHALNIEWPKGESLKFKGNLSTQGLKIKIKSQQQWFEYDGEIEINDNEVLNLKTLLSLLDGDNGSRFVKLEDGQFVALTESFRLQLAELKMISEGDKVFNLGSGVLDDLASEANEAKVDKKWQEHIKNVRARSQFTPVLPTTLQAELRDYQLEGFNYLSRLTNWNIGACLADDMGLGKTVQAIALLLEQAEYGPSLVIAPTSVCFNWVDELNKFAPSLNVSLLHNENQREQSIAGVTAGDVLVCSYNLLQYESTTLQSQAWNLLVLDEAQNIKNHTTKRFKAACELNSKRRIALSGTPIENHLGELWSLFRFLNPGLLGSLDKFQKKFITPISNKNKIAKQTLKNLIQPYVLRRTKTQVLSELPPKIEQSIYVEPSNEEMAFYEVVRQRALANIANLNADENKRFSILAEITRLRQACCHSSLVDENIKLENSKLTAFLELVQELIENKHKVLVFSQYVRYLEIVQQTLRDNKIDYQYIDGSTAINQRKTAVAEFQSGKGGDVFLISLKAGGTGLNLTAADYVIILDPWWNPAVEDQAADRAHRMGQQRPVTVYRLIMKNSIEEKIIHMHKDKRDLAGDLLSGQDVAGKLSEDDLINLMKL